MILYVVAAGSSQAIPDLRESVVTSQRQGDNFAYTISEHQGYMAGGAKPSSYMRALAPGELK